MKDLIVFMGGPGSGKGTIAANICGVYKMGCIEMGALIRALPQDSDVLRAVTIGNLAPDDAVYELIQQNLDPEQNIILDGFPRTLDQAKWFIRYFSERFNIKILYLSLSEELMKQRIKKRYDEGSNRADDANTDVIARRIKNFNNQTIPAIEWLAQNPDVHFYDIDGSKSIPEVTQHILDILGSK